MTTSRPRVHSDLPIPPGEILEEELEAQGMTQKELAARLSRPAQVINEIIRGKKAITAETAIGLGKVLGIDAQFWMNLESNYRITLARKREEGLIAANVEWLDEYPIRDMLKRGWIDAGRDRPSRLKALMDFLGVAVAEPQAFQKAVGFRITEAAQQRVSLGALAVWLRKGELDAQGVDTADYNDHAFTEALFEIRNMTSQNPSEFIPAICDLCAGAGVAFCMVRELPKSGANGATRWLTDRKALIQMSIRNKWADIFWFTFFHEACHLLKHRTQRRIVVDGLAADPDIAEIEAEANCFARDFLIPPQDWNDFRAAHCFTHGSVEEFSRSVGIAPFIVVGRLQKEDLIDYNQLTTLKLRYEWTEEEDG
jgi:HTH-type transcriptional regulator/antitoxin HigA